MNLLRLILEYSSQCESDALTEQQLFELSDNKIKFIVGKQKDAILKALAKDDKAAKDLIEDPKKPSEADAEQLVREWSKVSEKHLQWIINKYVSLQDDKLQFRLEDANRIKETIEQFEEDRRKLKKKDLMQYKTFAELEDAIDGEDYDDEPDLGPITAHEQEFIDKKEVVVLHRDSSLRVYVPKTKEAAQYFGRGTKWCTSAKSNSMFDHYAKQSDLFIIIAKGKKFQLHFKSGQNMDARDRPADVAQLFSDNPVLYKLFEKQAIEAGTLPMMSDDISVEKLEKAVLKLNKKSDFKDIVKELSSAKLKKIKAFIIDGLNKSTFKEIKQFFFNEYRSEDNEPLLKKFIKAFEPKEILELVTRLRTSRSDYTILKLKKAFLDYLLGDKSTGKALFDDYVKEAIDNTSSDDTVKILKIFAEKGYDADQESLDKILLTMANRLELLSAAIKELNLKPSDEIILKIIDKNHKAIEAFPDASNKIKERARMFQKRDAEKSWR
jgi:hypothetical protein